MVERAGNTLDAGTVTNLDKPDPQVTRDMDFVRREVRLSDIGEIGAVDVHVISEGLSARVCKRKEAPLHLDSDGFDSPRQVAADITHADDIDSAVAQAFIDCCNKAPE